MAELLQLVAILSAIVHITNKNKFTNTKCSFTDAKRDLSKVYFPSFVSLTVNTKQHLELVSVSVHKSLHCVHTKAEILPSTITQFPAFSFATRSMVRYLILLHRPIVQYFYKCFDVLNYSVKYRLNSATEDIKY